MASLTTLLSSNGNPKPGNQRGTSAPDPSIFLHVFLDLHFVPVLVHVRLTSVWYTACLVLMQVKPRSRLLSFLLLELNVAPVQMGCLVSSLTAAQVSSKCIAK